MARIKQPSAREVALTKLRVAGYHGDRATFTLVYIEARVSYAVAKEHYRRGADMRQSGAFRCSCHECRGAA